MENQQTRSDISQYVLTTAENDGGFSSGTLREDNSLNGVLGWDSLDRIDFIQKVEDNYHIRLNLDEEQNIETLKDVIDAVCRKLKIKI